MDVLNSEMPKITTLESLETKVMDLTPVSKNTVSLDVFDMEALYQVELSALQKASDDADESLFVLQADKNSRAQLKAARTTAHDTKTRYNKYIETHDRSISQAVIDELWRLETKKIIRQSDQVAVLPDSMSERVRKMYLLMASHGRLNSRYIKLPRDWMNLGYTCGLLEDLVVVFRTLGQLRIASTHLVSLFDLIKGFDEYMRREEKDGNHRFAFLSDLLLKKSVDFTEVFTRAVAAQGASKRIGSYVVSHGWANDDLKYKGLYLYAIQGMYGLEFDHRVTRSIHLEDYLDIEHQIPRYAIHFTRKEIAHSIWTKAPTTSHRKRSNGKPLESGAICRFDRVIHAITDIEQVHVDGADPYFVIAPKLKNIRERMSHGISEEMTRQKYEAGLVFDIKLLAEHYESRCLNDHILINEINTLLVHDDIPAHCIIDLLISDDDLNRFWAGTSRDAYVLETYHESCTIIG